MMPDYIVIFCKIVREILRLQEISQKFDYFSRFAIGEMTHNNDVTIRNILKRNINSFMRYSHDILFIC